MEDVDPEVGALEAEMDDAGQLPGVYDPAPGIPLARKAEDQCRIVLENHLARVEIMRSAKEAEAARIKVKGKPGWLGRYMAATRVAKKLREREWCLAEALDALPKQHPPRLAGPTPIARRYEHRSKAVLGHPSSSLPRRVGRHAKVTMLIGVVFCGLFLVQTFAGILESILFPYQPAAASYDDAPTFLFLNHTQIMADEDGYFQCWANGSVYLIAEIGGPDDAWGGDMAEFSFEEIGSDLPGEKWYTCTTGLHSWAYQLSDEMTLCNLTIPDWCRSRFTSLSVQPLYIARGETNATRTSPAQVLFNATGDIMILLWTVGNFSDLALRLNDMALKENTYENLGHMSIAVADVVFDSEWLQFPARVPSGQQTLEIWGEENATIYYQIMHATADFDEDLLLDYEEVINPSPALCPEVANPWGYRFISEALDDPSIEDIISGNDTTYWAPETISFYIPDTHVVASYDPLAIAGGGTSELELVDWNGQFKNFEVDGDPARLANVTLVGYTGSEFTPRSIVDSEGIELGTFLDYQLMFPDHISCNVIGLGMWHTISYEVLQGTAISPDLELSVDGQLVFLSPFCPDLAETDADGDSVPDDADRSPADYLTWREDTLLQLTVPCDRTSAEDVKIDIDVVRGPGDPDPTKQFTWHAGEVGARQVSLTQAMILYGPGSNALAQGLADYWNTTNQLQIFMDSAHPWPVDTYDLRGFDANGKLNDTAITGDCDPLPQNGTMAYDYQMLVMPTQATNVSTYTLWYPSDHPAIQNDGFIVLRVRFVIAVIAEDSNLLGFYDYPADINISAIAVDFLSDVNGLLGQPRDASENLILWACNMNPQVTLDASAGDVRDQAIVANFTGGHFMTQYNYDDAIPSTWGATERLIYARNATPWDGTSAEVTYLTSTTRTLDLLSKINQSIKFDLITGEQYCVYPQQFNFASIGEGLLIYQENQPVISGWTGSGYGLLDILRNVQTRANVTSLYASGASPLSLRLDGGSANETGTMAFSLYIPSLDDKCEIRFGNSSSMDAFALVVEKEDYGERMWVQYRTPEDTLEKICEVWPGEWFTFEVWWDNGSNSFLTPNCSTWDVFMSGAMDYAAIDLPSWHPCWQGIQYVDFQVFAGDTVNFDGFGFYAGQFGPDAEYAGTSPETVHFGDSRSRSSFYTVSDVYNGTFIYGDSQLKSDEITLWGTFYSRLQHLMERAVVSLWPVGVQFRRVDDSLYDGFQVDQFLNITFASVPEIPAADLPGSPGSAFSWQIGDVPVTTYFPHLLANEWVSDVFEVVPTTVDFDLGDEVRWEFNWRAGDADPWAVFCSRQSAPWEDIISNYELIKSFEPLEEVGKWADKFIADCESGELPWFQYDVILPAPGRRRQDFVDEHRYVNLETGSSYTNDLSAFNFVRVHITRDTYCEEAKAYRAALRGLYDAIANPGDIPTWTVRRISIFSEERLTDPEVDQLSDDPATLIAQGWEIGEPWDCPTRLTERIGGKTKQSYWKMVNIERELKDSDKTDRTDALRAFDVAIKKYRPRKIGSDDEIYGGTQSVWLSKALNQGGDSPLLTEWGAPGKRCLLFVNPETNEEIWAEALPPLDAPEIVIDQRTGIGKINLRQYYKNRGWVGIVGRKEIPVRTFNVEGVEVTIQESDWDAMIYVYAKNPKFFVGNPVVWKDPQTCNPAEAEINGRIVNPEHTSSGGMANAEYLDKGLAAWVERDGDPVRAQKYAERQQSLHALRDKTGKSDASRLEGHTSLMNRITGRDTYLRDGWLAMDARRSEHPDLRPLVLVWAGEDADLKNRVDDVMKAFPSEYTSQMLSSAPHTFLQQSGRDWQGMWKKADERSRAFIAASLKAKEIPDPNQRDAKIAQLMRSFNRDMYAILPANCEKVAQSVGKIRGAYLAEKAKLLGSAPFAHMTDYAREILEKLGIPVPEIRTASARLPSEDTAAFEVKETDAVPGEEARSPTRKEEMVLDCWYEFGDDVHISGVDLREMDVKVQKYWSRTKADGTYETTTNYEETLEWEEKPELHWRGKISEKVTCSSQRLFWAYVDMCLRVYGRPTPMWVMELLDEYYKMAAHLAPPPEADQRIPPSVGAGEFVEGLLGFRDYFGRISQALTMDLFIQVFVKPITGGSSFVSAIDLMGDAVASANNPTGGATGQNNAVLQPRPTPAPGPTPAPSPNSMLTNPFLQGSSSSGDNVLVAAAPTAKFQPMGVSVKSSAARELGNFYNIVDEGEYGLLLQELDDAIEAGYQAGYQFSNIPYKDPIITEFGFSSARAAKILAVVNVVCFVIGIVTLVNDWSRNADDVTLALDVFNVVALGFSACYLIGGLVLGAIGVSTSALAATLSSIVSFAGVASTVCFYIGLAIIGITLIVYGINWYFNQMNIELTTVSADISGRFDERDFVRHGGLRVGDNLRYDMMVNNTGDMWCDGWPEPVDIWQESDGAPFWFGSRMTAGQYEAGAYTWASNSWTDEDEWDGPWDGTELDWPNWEGGYPGYPYYPHLPDSVGDLMMPWLRYYTEDGYHYWQYDRSVVTYDMQVALTQPATQLAIGMIGRVATTYDHDSNGVWRQDHDPMTMIDTTVLGDENGDGVIDLLYETPVTVIEADMAGFMSNCTAVNVSTSFDQYLVAIANASAHYQWYDAYMNASALAALAASESNIFQYDQVAHRLQSLAGLNQTWRENITASQWHSLTIPKDISDNYYLLQTDSCSEYASLLSNQTLLAAGWRAARLHGGTELIYASNFPAVPDNGFPSEWTKPVGAALPKIWPSTYHGLYFEDPGLGNPACTAYKDLGPLNHAHATLTLEYQPIGEWEGRQVAFGFATSDPYWVTLIHLEDGVFSIPGWGHLNSLDPVPPSTPVTVEMDFDYVRNVGTFRYGTYEASFSLIYHAIPTRFWVYFEGQNTYAGTTQFIIGNLTVGHWTEHWEGTGEDLSLDGYDLTSPAGQILVPKTWVNYINKTRGLEEYYSNPSDVFPCLTNIRAEPSWAEIPVVMPGDVLSGALQFTYEGTDNPAVAYALTPPAGWGISLAGGTDSLLSITSIQFDLTVPVDAPAGIYYLYFSESIASGAKAGNTTYACVLPVRIYQNNSWYLDVGEFPSVMNVSSAYAWAHLFNGGTQPQSLLITGGGVPYDWLTADGFAPVMVWDFTASTSDWHFTGGTSAITGGALVLQSTASERVSANVSLDADLHPGDRVHVIYENQGAVSPMLAAWDSFTLTGSGLQERTFAIDAFETLDCITLAANVTTGTSFRVTHLSVDRALTRYAPLSQFAFYGTTANIGDWGWDATFRSGESTIWMQAPVTNASYVDSSLPDTNFNAYHNMLRAVNYPMTEQIAYFGVPLIEDVIGAMGFQTFESAQRYLTAWSIFEDGVENNFVAYGCGVFDESNLTYNTKPLGEAWPISKMSHRTFNEEWNPNLPSSQGLVWDLSAADDRFILVNCSMSERTLIMYDDESTEYGGKARPYVAVGVPKVGIDGDLLVLQSDTTESFEIAHDLAEGGQPVSLAAGDEVWVNFASILSSQVTLTLTNANPAEDDFVFVLDTGLQGTQGFELRNFVVPAAGEYTSLKISGTLAPAENFSLYFAGVYKYQPNGISFADMDIGGYYNQTIAPTDFTCELPSVLAYGAGHWDVLALQDNATVSNNASYTFPAQAEGRLDFALYAPGTNQTLLLELVGAGGAGILLNISNYQLWCSNNSEVVSPIYVYGGWHYFSVAWDCAQHNYTVWHNNQTVVAANYTTGVGILHLAAGAITGIQLNTTVTQAPFLIDGVYLDQTCHAPTNESLVELRYAGAGMNLMMRSGEEWTLYLTPGNPGTYAGTPLAIYDGGQLVGLLHQDVAVNSPPAVTHCEAYSYISGIEDDKQVAWNITDGGYIAAGATWAVFCNGTPVAGDSWISSNTSVTIPTSNQVPGTYLYELWVNDGYTGNQLLDSTTVYVLDAPPEATPCANYSYSTFEEYNRYAYWNLTHAGELGTSPYWEIRLGAQVVKSGAWADPDGEIVYSWTGNQMPGSYVYALYADDGYSGLQHVSADINVTAYNGALPSSSSPGDCSFWTGRESAIITWVLTDAGIKTGAGKYEVYRNDTVPFKVASGAFTHYGQFVSYTVEDLPPRAYNFSLYVTDGMSGWVWADNVTVSANNTLPTANHVDDYDYYTFIDTDNQISWTINDLGAILLSKAKIQVRLNGSLVSSLDFDLNPYDVVILTVDQMPGIYNYTLWADDGFSGFVMLDEVLVAADDPNTVLDITRLCQMVNTAWSMAGKNVINGYNYGDPNPPLAPIHWQLEDVYVGPSGGLYKVQFWNSTVQWADVNVSFPGTPNATGTWVTTDDIADIYFTPPAGLCNTTYKFRLRANDTWPNLPYTAIGDATTEATVIINSPPALSAPTDGSYTDYQTTYTISWSYSDAMVDGGTYQVYRKQYGDPGWTPLSGTDSYGHAANGSIGSSGSITWVCSGDFVSPHSSNTTHQYKVVIDDGYGATNEDTMQVTAYANPYVGDWTAQSYNGLASVSSDYTSTRCYQEYWYSWRAQDWWVSKNECPRNYKSFNYTDDFWFQTHLSSVTIHVSQQMGIALYYSPTYVWLWGLYVNDVGIQSVRLDKIINNVGYNVWSQTISGVRDFGIEWSDNQARFSYYSGGWQSTGWYSLGFNPGYLMTFNKEWRCWDAPDRYCVFDNNYWGIYQE